MRETSGTGGPGGDDFLRFVEREVGNLGTDDILTIADFGPDQATVQEVRLNPAGTPRGMSKHSPWPTLMREDALSVDKLAALLRTAPPGRLLLALSASSAGSVPSEAADAGPALAISALNQASRLRPDAPVFVLGQPADGLVKQAVSRIPLSQWYELAAVRQTRSGRLVLTTQPLFPPGLSRGEERTFGFRVEPAVKPGTALVVLAREDDADPPEYRVAQAPRSAPLQPGWHEVTAKLLGRGRVRFEGLSAPLEEEPRSWAEVRAAVPPQISRPAPAHLIIALELCGNKDGDREPYIERVDCAVRLIEEIAEDARTPVRFSLVGYGSHAFVRMTPESPVEELCWAESDTAALGVLHRLAMENALAPGSTAGAMLECALDFTARRLAADGRPAERPALVTIGTRRPFPPRYQGPSDALPCPHRVDWRQPLNALAGHYRDMTFGAIYGGGDPPPQAWIHLGRDARGVPSGFDARQFAAGLGLIGPVPENFPLPLIEEGVY